MATLRSLLEKRQTAAHSKVEAGQVYVYKPTAVINAAPFCWVAPAAGQAVIEIWGGNGGASPGCCCGSGIPGNSGAYSRRTVTVAAGWYVCGCVGAGGCGYTGPYCGTCGCGTGVTVFNASAVSQGCMCAQGGTGGRWVCWTGSNPYCCFISIGYCFTTGAGAGCGTICNYGGPVASTISQAFGGDVNIQGGLGKRKFEDCTWSHYDCVPWSPGVVSECAGYSTSYHTSACLDTSTLARSILAASSRKPSQNHVSCCFDDYLSFTGVHVCRSTGKTCGQEFGSAGGSTNIASGIINYGGVGGSGLVRIKLIS